MIPRGEVGLITASVGLAAGLLTSEVYSILVVLVLATTLLTPVLLRYAAATTVPDAKGDTAVGIVNNAAGGDWARTAYQDLGGFEKQSTPVHPHGCRI